MLKVDNPMLKIVKSSCKMLPEGAEIPLQEAIKSFHRETFNKSNYAFKEVKYNIIYFLDSDLKTYSGIYIIGYDYQSLIASIAAAADKTLDFYKTYGKVFIRREGIEKINSEIIDAIYLKEKAVPYFRKVCYGKSF